MRIAHIITRMIVGGAQENTLYCCRDLRHEHGDDVVLITGPALGPEGDLLQQVDAGDVPVMMLDALRRPIHPFRDRAAYRQIRHALRTIQPDVVHTHSAKGGFLGRLAAWSVGIPAIVHTVHGAPFHPYQSAAARQLFIRCERYAAKRCHRLISVADAMTDLMVSARVAPREKFTTIYSGMDVEPFLQADAKRAEVRRELGLKPDHVVIGKIARLFHLKGHHDLLQAAERMLPDYPNVRMLWVGDGLLRSNLERRIADAGLADRFILTGLVPPARIPELIGAMDALVHVSYREGLARALPQALIAGKPVISYDIDGAAEVVLPETTGLLVPPGDIAGLERSMRRVAGDAALRVAWGREGRRRFTEQFRHTHMTRQIRQLYAQLLENPRA